MDQLLLDEINSGFGNLRKRLEELEKVYCRYQGPRGEKGAPAKVSVGRVEVGDTASVKVRPLDGNIYELDFVLPPGKDGRDGYDGKDGVSNIPGPAGPAGRNGRDGVDGRVVVGQVVNGHFAAATVRVEDDVQIIDLVLPRGPQGERGSDGSQGPQGPQGTPGTDARDGKDSVVPGPPGRDGRDGKDGVSNLPGPRGERGEVGPQGIRGLAGPVGPAGPPGPQGLRGPVGRPGDISAAVAQAEQEARNVVQEAFAEIQARLARLEQAAK